MEEVTVLQDSLMDMYVDFKHGIPICDIAEIYGVTNAEAFALVQMGKRIWESLNP